MADLHAGHLEFNQWLSRYTNKLMQPYKRGEVNDLLRMLPPSPLCSPHSPVFSQPFSLFRISSSFLTSLSSHFLPSSLFLNSLPSFSLPPSQWHPFLISLHSTILPLAHHRDTFPLTSPHLPSRHPKLRSFGLAGHYGAAKVWSPPRQLQHSQRRPRPLQHPRQRFLQDTKSMEAARTQANPGEAQQDT